MILTQCSTGAACFCPVVPANDAQCFVIWGWIVLLVFIVSTVTFGVWYTWSVFFKALPGVSARERRQRQKTFWVLAFFFAVAQIAMSFMRGDDPTQLAAWCALAAVLAVGFCVWLWRRKHT
jgi:lipopolysaccharide export LptBFGC system permease protein LptF